MSYNKSKKGYWVPQQSDLGIQLSRRDHLGPIVRLGLNCLGAQLSSAKLPWNLLKPMLLVQVDYWTEDHWNYDYMQQMNTTMPSLNSTLIGVTAVRKHRIYSFYYQNLTR